jgi:hypothetical protein
MDRSLEWRGTRMRRAVPKRPSSTGLSGYFVLLPDPRSGRESLAAFSKATRRQQSSRNLARSREAGVDLGTGFCCSGIRG